MSKIEWTDITWNPVTGCTPISAGCQNCYARTMARRLAGRYGYPEYPNHFDVTLHEDRLDEPLHWRKPRQVFVCSMGDLFHDDIDDDFLYAVWMTMIKAKQHTFQVLTKRPRWMMDFVSLVYDIFLELRQPPENIWLGVTVENQATADERIPILLRTPGALHYVSLEPLLGLIDLRQYLYSRCSYCGGHLEDCTIDGLRRCSRPYWGRAGGRKQWETIDWVIAGKETGPGARHCDLDWLRSLRDQCETAGVPFFLKKPQLLDGKEYRQWPTV